MYTLISRVQKPAASSYGQLQDCMLSSFFWHFNATVFKIVTCWYVEI